MYRVKKWIIYHIPYVENIVWKLFKISVTTKVKNEDKLYYKYVSFFMMYVTQVYYRIHYIRDVF